MEINRYSPIAVFDSGLGGISVLREMKKEMPNENYIYLGDSANAPYGDKTADEVRDLAENVFLRLLSLGAKAVVIACNTATSAAAEYLREKYPSVPIIGMEPAIKPAALSAEKPVVFVMATALTLKEKKFCALADRYSSSSEIVKIPCPGLVELIESGMLCGAELESLLHRLLDGEIKKHAPGAVVLGCTHYIHIRDEISSFFGPDVKIFDGTEGTVRETKRKLEEKGLLTSSSDEGTVTIMNSSDDASFIGLSEKLLNR